MDDPLSRPGEGCAPVFRVGYVPGVQPDKWLRRWRERTPVTGVVASVHDAPLGVLARARDARGVDLAFVREADDAPRSAPAGLLRIPLYTETMAVLAAKGHEVTAFGAVELADLDGERWLEPLDPIASTSAEVGAAVDLVAANVGLLVLPLPYARALSRRDVVVRELGGAPATRMGVAWAAEREGDPLIDEFVGIVRGRTANSSRGGGETPAQSDTRMRKTPPERSRLQRKDGRRR